MTEQNLEKLKVWQLSHQLMLNVHRRLLPLLPKYENYDLADQVKRSSKRAGANIAEGSGRFYYMDNVRYCYQARGSLDETLNHLIVARDLGYCPDELYGELRAQVEEIRRMLNGYIAYLKNRKIGEKEPGAYLYSRGNPPESIVAVDEQDAAKTQS